MRRLGLLLACLGVFLVSSARAHAERETLLDSPNWGVVGETGKYYAAIGTSDPSSEPKTELAFIFDVPARRFYIVIARPPAAPPGPLPLLLMFRPANPSKPLPPLRLSASGPNMLKAMLSDSDVATWTHGFTAGTAMTASFASAQWTFDLSGTSAAVSAMAAAIGAAGIDGLPPPWQSTGYGNAPAADPQVAAREGLDRAATAEQQRRQLAIAKAEAEKAQADAKRAQSEAVRARAEADRAQAEAQVQADAKARVAEAARADAERIAEAQRKIAAQRKAEQDARGTEP